MAYNYFILVFRTINIGSRQYSCKRGREERQKHIEILNGNYVFKTKLRRLEMYRRHASIQVFLGKIFTNCDVLMPRKGKKG